MWSFLPVLPTKAGKRNIDREQLAEVLSRYIPKIIDELTPTGQMQARR